MQTLNDPELERLVLACAEWVRDVKEKLPARWLTLTGNSGTGKTLCAFRLFRFCENRPEFSTLYFRNVAETDPRYCAYPCEFIHWPSFVSDLRAGIAYERLRDMRNWPCLFLDEVGGERDTTGFASEQLATLLGTRAGKWTVITSNLSMSEFEKLDIRIASRMVRDGSTAIEINTTDFALRSEIKSLNSRIAGMA